MGYAVFEFLCPDSFDVLAQKLDTWKTSTKKGRRYRYKKPSHGYTITLKRVIGFLIAPIYLEFKISGKKGSSTRISAIDYIKN